MSFLRTAASSPVVTPNYTGLQVQTSSSALPIPIVYGMARVAPNIIWANNFKSMPQYSQTSAGGKGGLFSPSSGPQQSGYDYTTAIIMGLCEGPINTLVTAFNGQSASSPSDIDVFFLSGTTPQAPWGWLAANYPGQSIGYGGTAIAVSSYYDLGSSASIGSLSFEIAGLLYGSGTVDANDADPAGIIYDFLTSAQYGVGFPAASIDATTLYGGGGDASYQTYCRAHRLAFSPALTNQEAANSILARWLQLTNATAVWSGGRLKIIPYGDAAATGTQYNHSTVTYQPVATPVYDLTDDDFVADSTADPVIVTRSDPYSAANVIMLEALDRLNQYSPTTIEARDQGSIEQTGLRSGAAVTAHEFCNLTIAATSAQLILQRGLYIRNTYAFRLSWEYCLLEPMDLVTLTDAGLGLAKTPVRIIEIAEDGAGLLSVTAEEFPGQVGTTAGFSVDSAANSPINRTVAPAAINPPLIVEPPSDLTNGVPQLWVGLSGGTDGVADPNWGGAVIFASTDNATYTQVGSTTGPARQGVLASALGAPPGLGSDTLTISFAESGATVLAGAQPTLFVADGEIMSFANATLTAPNTYSLGGLARRRYGQRGGAHAIGSQGLILDQAVFAYTLPPAAIGQTLWFKFASLNTFGRAMQDLSTCTAYAVTPVGSGYFGPVAQAIATGTSLDEGLASTTINETDDFGLASDPYTDTIDMGLASEAATALAVQSGGTGATSPAVARSNIGAAASGANGDITSLDALTAATINKAGLGDTAAISYTTGGSARASAGLLASDRYRVSVSSTGSGFTQAIDIDPATGHIGLAGYTADSNNALGILGTNFLFSAATDSCRFTFNKAATANDASLTFETGFSARALAGLLGSDGFQLKVSPDGSSFYQAYVVDQTNGNTAFKALLSVASYPVASLPAGLNGALAFATNGRKTGEAAGAGTGAVVAFSNGQWRRLSDDSIVVS